MLTANAQAERILRRSPASIHEADEHGATPLHHAAERGNVTLVARLWELGASVHVVDERGGGERRSTRLRMPVRGKKHPLPMWSPCCGNMVPVATCIPPPRWATSTHYAPPPLTPRSTRPTITAERHCSPPRVAAARNNQPEAVRVLLDKGADPNIACSDGQTPMSTACLHTLSQECDTEIVRLLARRGARMSVAAAIVLENVDALRGFVQRDPALLAGQSHDSALGYAIHAWRPASLRCLIERGARPNAENRGHIERIARDATELQPNSNASPIDGIPPMTRDIELIDERHPIPMPEPQASAVPP